MTLNFHDYLKIMSCELSKEGFITSKTISHFENDMHFFEKLSEDVNSFTSSKLFTLLAFLKWNDSSREEEYRYFLLTINKFYQCYSNEYEISYWDYNLGAMFNEHIVSPFMISGRKQTDFKQEFTSLAVTLKNNYNFYMNYNLSLFLNIQEIYTDHESYDKNLRKYYEFLVNDFFYYPRNDLKGIKTTEYFKIVFSENITNLQNYYNTIYPAVSLISQKEHFNKSIERAINILIGDGYYSNHLSDSMLDSINRLTHELSSSREKEYIHQILNSDETSKKRKRI